MRWLQAKNHADAVCLFPIYPVRKIPNAKVCLEFIRNQNLVCPAYRLTSVQAVSCFKQTNDMPVHLRFYAQCRSGQIIYCGSILQFSVRTKFRSPVCCTNKPIVLHYDHFSANATFSWHYLIETINRT